MKYSIKNKGTFHVDDGEKQIELFTAAKDMEITVSDFFARNGKYHAIIEIKPVENSENGVW